MKNSKLKSSTEKTCVMMFSVESGDEDDRYASDS